MPFRFQLLLVVLIGLVHGSLLAAGDYTRRLLDLEPRDRRGLFPKGWWDL